MLNSIEARSPYLSSNIINFVKTNLKKNDLYNNNKTKIFLKNYAKQILPKNFQFERKQGFSFHFDKFIKSKPNLIKIEQLLTNDNSIFKAEQVAKLLKLASNSLIKSEIVFAIFFFQIWINKNINKV